MKSHRSSIVSVIPFLVLSGGVVAGLPFAIELNGLS